MKIVSTCRTYNNAAIIGRFCEAYQDIADVILIADGGSTDATVEVALRYPKVEVIEFPERIEVQGGYSINPQGKHVNFLIREALARGATWITFDDSDCVPNFLLQWQGKDRIAMAELREQPAVYLRRVYFWGEDEVFPNLHKPNTSIWAWRFDAGVRADEVDPIHLHMILGDLRLYASHLEFPFCLLHYSWPSPEEAKVKVKWYRESGVQPTAAHPSDFAGPKEEAQWFMSTRPPIVKARR